MVPHSKIEDTPAKPDPRRFGQRSRTVPVLALTAMAGLLIWAKLRLVTDFPRIVQAEPRATEPEAAADDPAVSPPTHSGRETAPDEPAG